MTNPRTPVIVAAEQRNHRTLGSEPIDAMAAAVEPLLTSTESRVKLAGRIGSLRVLRGLWPYADPGRLLADQLDLGSINLGAVHTTLSPIGGNEVYDLVTVTAADIQRGDLDVAVICAAETGRTRRKLAAAGDEPTYRDESDNATPDLQYGTGRPRMLSEQQVAIGAWEATIFYAMVESAIRHANDETVADHRQRIATLWSRASDVAAQNPHAWITEPTSVDDIASVSPQNRMVAAPYPKLMTSNIAVDQSAAVLMCSYEAAIDAGFTEEEMVFLVSGAGATDHWSVEERWTLHESPAMRIAGALALELADLSLDETGSAQTVVGDIDLYSCFPSAIQVAQSELGLDVDRPFTATGGLTFAGGPFNSYCLHALATTYERIVAGKASNALLSGNGGFFTNHSFVVIAAEPPEAGFRNERPQAEVDALPKREFADSGPSTGELEAYSVVFDRDAQPSRAIATVLDSVGSRHWASSDDADVVAAMLAEDLVGSSLDLAPNDDGTSVLLAIR